MKIVHAHWSLNMGGIETMMVDIMNEQVKDHEVWCLILNDVINENVKTKISPKVYFVCYHRKPGTYNIFPIIKFNIDLYRIKPDIIHLHGEKFPRIVLLCKAPIVLTRHNVRGKGVCLCGVSQLCFISEAVRQYSLMQGYDGIVVNNGIHCENITRKKYTSDKKETYHIVQVGRLEMIKGQHLLIKAARILMRHSVKQFSIDIIGGGSCYDDLLAMIKDNHLEDRVFMLGVKDREYIYSHLCNYDLLVQPSLSEGFGLTIAEGMAAGISILTSDLDGPMQVIDYGRCGDYFKTGDVDDLANKLEKFILKKTQDKTKDAMMWSNENFTIQNTVNKYLSIYNSLIKRLK